MKLTRTTFETSRAAEYFDARELQAQTGQPIERFAAVALKELCDNALDACETAGIAPEIGLHVTTQGAQTQIAIRDNGGGIPPETVRRVLNFNTRTSDKAAYRAPLRGAQGNALKTIVGIPYALGVSEPVTITAQGVRHTIRAGIDPAGELRVEYNQDAAPPSPGTQVCLTLPNDGQDLHPDYWARAVALTNPHASIRIGVTNDGAEQAKSREDDSTNFYQRTVAFPAKWRKFLPSDPTSAHWYDRPALSRLVFSHIAHARNGGRDMTLREFVRQFRGLSGSAKAKAVCDRLPQITRLSDFEGDENALSDLLLILQETAPAPSPHVLGRVGEAHFRHCFDAWFGVKRFWYAKDTGQDNGIPFVFEAAVAETERPGSFFPAINFSPTFEDPLAGTHISTSKVSAFGIEGFLNRAHAAPTPDAFYGESLPVAVAVHLVCPVLAFLDRGKTRLKLEAAR